MNEINRIVFLIKLLCFFTLIFPLSSLAKTQGNYFNIDVIRTGIDYKGNGSDNDRVAGVTFGSEYVIGSDKEISYSASYEYAFNMKDAFIAPGLFYDKFDMEISDFEPGFIPNKWRFTDRFGANVKIGYDVSDWFAIFANIGYGFVKTEAEINDFVVSLGATNINLSGRREDKLYGSILGGLGFKLQVSDNVDMNFGADFSKVKVNLPSSEFYYDFDLVIFRTGFSYNF